MGGNGNDEYYVRDDIDVLVENANEGNDSVKTIFNWTLGANFENLYLQYINDVNGTGNSLDNIIAGNSGNNVLDGAGGNDILLALAIDVVLASLRWRQNNLAAIGLAAVRHDQAISAKCRARKGDGSRRAQCIA